MFQISVLFEDDRLGIREPHRQAVFQRGADEVFRTKTRAGMHEKDVVGQVSQTRTQEKGLHKEQPIVLTSRSSVLPIPIQYYYDF